MYIIIYKIPWIFFWNSLSTTSTGVFPSPFAPLCFRFRESRQGPKLQEQPHHPDWAWIRKEHMNKQTTMGTHVSFIFRGYNPYIGGRKPSFFMALGSKGTYWKKNMGKNHQIYEPKLLANKNASSTKTSGNKKRWMMNQMEPNHQ